MATKRTRLLTRSLLNVVLAVAAAGLVGCSDRPVDGHRQGNVSNVISEPPHEQTDQEPKPDEPPKPLATCGEAGSAVGQATYDVADADVAAGICEQSSAHCIVCVQPDGSGRFAVYQYESIDCACPELPSTLPEPPPPPPEPQPEPVPVVGCGEPYVGYATYDLEDRESAQALCEAGYHCTVCDQPDDSGRFVVYNYQDVECTCPAG